MDTYIIIIYTVYILFLLYIQYIENSVLILAVAAAQANSMAEPCNTEMMRGSYHPGIARRITGL